MDLDSWGTARSAVWLPVEGPVQLQPELLKRLVLLWVPALLTGEAQPSRQAYRAAFQTSRLMRYMAPDQRQI